MVRRHCVSAEGKLGNSPVPARVCGAGIVARDGSAKLWGWRGSRPAGSTVRVAGFSPARSRARSPGDGGTGRGPRLSAER